MTTPSTPPEPLDDPLARLVPDPAAREAIRLALLPPRGGEGRERARPSDADDPWTNRARPTFLYVMYVLLLWAIPMGLIAAVQPGIARNMATGMRAYLNAIPEPLYALFGTGYLGYTVARSWAKARGVDR